MATVAQLRTAIAAALDGIAGLQCSPYALSNPTPPGIHVLPDELEFDQTMHRGLDVWMFNVQAFVAFDVDTSSQAQLDTLLDATGPTSVKTVLETDATLGGLVDQLQVTKASGYRLVDRTGGGQMILVEFTVRVLASN